MRLVFLLFIGMISFSAFGEVLCGVTQGYSYNKDNGDRPYRLSGFWLKQNTKDIRITYGKSPSLVEAVEGLVGNIFVCLDDYELLKKKYSGKVRIYGKVVKFRVWVNGEQVRLDNDEVLYNLETQKSVMDMFTDPLLDVWDRSTDLKNLCFMTHPIGLVHQNILEFRDQEILFDFDTETYVNSWVDEDKIIVFALNGKLMDDGLSEREATKKYVIEKCGFQ